MGSPIRRDTFLARAKKRFGDHYDYSEIAYKSYKTPIKIRCKHHPVRVICITPERHLQTTGGCKFCLRDLRIQTLERELQRPAHQRQLASLLSQKLNAGATSLETHPVSTTTADGP